MESMVATCCGFLKDQARIWVRGLLLEDMRSCGFIGIWIWLGIEGGILCFDNFKTMHNYTEVPNYLSQSSL